MQIAVEARAEELQRAAVRPLVAAATTALVTCRATTAHWRAAAAAAATVAAARGAQVGRKPLQPGDCKHVGLDLTRVGREQPRWWTRRGSAGRQCSGG
eukprot:4414391-Prymnesium_polylepis.1